MTAMVTSLAPRILFTFSSATPRPGSVTDLVSSMETLAPGNITEFDPFMDYFSLTIIEFYIGHVACGVVPLVISLIPGIYVLINITEERKKHGFHKLPFVKRISMYLSVSDVGFSLVRLLHNILMLALIQPLPGSYCYVTGIFFECIFLMKQSSTWGGMIIQNK